MFLDDMPSGERAISDLAIQVFYRALPHRHVRYCSCWIGTFHVEVELYQQYVERFCCF